MFEAVTLQPEDQKGCSSTVCLLLGGPYHVGRLPVGNSHCEIFEIRSGEREPSSHFFSLCSLRVYGWTLDWIVSTPNLRSWLFRCDFFAVLRNPWYGTNEEAALQHAHLPAREFGGQHEVVARSQGLQVDAHLRPRCSQLRHGQIP